MVKIIKMNREMYTMENVQKKNVILSHYVYGTVGCIFNSVMDYCNYKKYKETNIKTKEINVDPL